MRRLCIIAVFLSSYAIVSAQTVFRTVVPKGPLEVGESFQVQYILEDGGTTELIRPPSFTNFRLVSGPSFYKGSVVTMNGVRPLSNAVFTLEALKPGRFLIPGATVVVGDKKIRSNNAEVIVVAGDEAVLKKEANHDYYLQPGEDAYRKIRENLFLKVQVDRRSCYVGEPVLATFKLYSRLQSRSDIIKNPGLYGFSVYDIVNLSDRQSSVENIGGKLFDVHTIRKVQLFPLQSGTLYIDEMEVRNRVEFSRSVINKKTEQEIVEGMMGFPEEELLSEGAEIFESEMHTEPVMVTVKPLPPAGKPSNYRGAVGKFEVESALSEQSIRSNSEGVFIITIRGEGNFMQIDAPRPEWPAGMEVFEPKVSDVMDRSSYPLRGERSFSYPFVVSRKGEFKIPAVDFHYFNPDSGKYQTVTTSQADFAVKTNKILPPVLVPSNKPAALSWYLILGGAFVALSSFFFFFYLRKRKKDRQAALLRQAQGSLVDRLLIPAVHKIQSTDREFYSSLLQVIWKFFELRAGLSGTAANKSRLFAILQDKNADNSMLADLSEVLHTCEAGMFTNASLHLDKKTILDKSREILHQAEKLF